MSKITKLIPKNTSSTLKFAAKGLFIVAIFWLGLAIGSGRINVGMDAIFKKSVSKDLPSNLDYSGVEKVYDLLRNRYDGQLDIDELLNGLKQGLVESAGDPYTEYLDEKEAAEFNEQLNGTFTGIGAELGKDKDGNLIIVAPIAGFPAQKAGLRARDVITRINDESTADMTVSEAVTKIRGAKGSKVTLKVVRNKEDSLSFTIIRAEIKIPSVKSEIIDGSIGYLKVSVFSEDTAQLARQAAASLKAQGVGGIILDLRGNPGGLLGVAVEIADLWLEDNETILTERRGGVVIKTYSASDGATLGGLPTVVLIDEGSASASEITAGALRDNDVATLMGAKSFGKGSVQEIEEISGGAQLKVTIARWYTPDGKNIDKQGIAPDKAVKMTDKDFASGKDPQLDAAKAFVKSKL